MVVTLRGVGSGSVLTETGPQVECQERPKAGDRGRELHLGLPVKSQVEKEPLGNGYAYL